MYLKCLTSSVSVHLDLLRWPFSNLNLPFSNFHYSLLRWKAEKMLMVLLYGLSVCDEAVSAVFSLYFHWGRCENAEWNWSRVLLIQDIFNVLSSQPAESIKKTSKVRRTARIMEIKLPDSLWGNLPFCDVILLQYCLCTCYVQETSSVLMYCCSCVVKGKNIRFSLGLVS